MYGLPYVQSGGGVGGLGGYGGYSGGGMGGFSLPYQPPFPQSMGGGNLSLAQMMGGGGSPGQPAPQWGSQSLGAGWV